MSHIRERQKILDIGQVKIGDNIVRSGGNQFITDGRPYEIIETLPMVFIISDNGFRYSISEEKLLEKWELCQMTTSDEMYLDELTRG